MPSLSFAVVPDSVVVMDSRRHAARKLLFAAALCFPTTAFADDMARWRGEAARVTITRDDWGVAHVHGKSDADAVFGAVYAQAEDDFGRIEANYLTALGRTAEAEGSGAIWADLRQRLYVDPAALQNQYRISPAWLRGLMDAWADGLNYYLATHPAVRPKVLTRFEPGRTYTEPEVNEVLRAVHDDVAYLRRELVNYHYLERADGRYRTASGAPERLPHQHQEIPAWEAHWLPGFLAGPGEAGSGH